MKTNAIVRIIVYSIILLILASMLVFGILADGFSFQLNWGENLDNMLNAGVSFDAERVSKIDIDWAAGSIILHGGEPRGAEGDITVMPLKADEKYPITYEIDGNTLKISYTNATVGIQVGSIPEQTLEIWVPQDWLCEELEIDGAALDLVFENVNIEWLDIDGADCTVGLNGSVERLDCDGAACVLDLNCDSVPYSIDLDGVDCTLDLVMPENSGFLVQMDGLSCTFNSSLPYTMNGKNYVYGDQQCRIDADGVSCAIKITTGK